MKENQSNNKFNWKRYAIYHGKWQLSTIVTIPLMYFFADFCGLPYWASILSFNIIGAIMFWPIDNWIFRNKSK